MKKVSDPHDDPDATALRKRSGNISTNDKLVEFLYVLMRDRVLPGEVEYVMLQLAAEERLFGKKNKRTGLTNGWLAGYANDIARRLTGKIAVPKKKSELQHQHKKKLKRY